MYGYKYTENCVNMNIHQYIHMYVYAHLCVALAEMHMFSLAQAQELGVGASLHLRPPGRAANAGVPQPGLALCTLSNVDESSRYDLQMVTWRRIREDCLQPTTDRVDISDGHLFPWWLMLGGTGRHRRLLDRGVTRVVASGRTLEVTLLDGEIELLV